jgi:hypothetical protein
MASAATERGLTTASSEAPSFAAVAGVEVAMRTGKAEWISISYLFMAR